MTTGLQAVIDLQDAEAKISLVREEAKRVAQQELAWELMSDIRLILPPYITLRVLSNIKDGHALTHVVFGIPPEILVPVERLVRICTKDAEGNRQILVPVVTPEIKAHHRDMLKDLAFVTRGIRDAVKARSA